MFKRKSVVMLPTKSNKADLYKIITGGKYANDKIEYKLRTNLSKMDKNSNYTEVKYQYLYILSEEDMYKGDWAVVFYHGRKELHQIVDKDAIGYICKGDYKFDQTAIFKKVIATNDTEIQLVCSCGHPKTVSTGLCTSCSRFTNMTLPSSSDEFIKAYAKAYNNGNPIVDVDVEYEQIYEDCLEGMEFVLRPAGKKLKVDRNNTITIKKIKDSWTKNEVQKLITELMHQIHRGEITCDGNRVDIKLSPEQWLNKNL